MKKLLLSVATAMVAMLYLLPLAFGQEVQIVDGWVTPDWHNPDTVTKFAPFYPVGGGVNYVGTQLQDGYEVIVTIKNTSDFGQQERLNFYDANGSYTPLLVQDSRSTVLNKYFGMQAPQAAHSSRQMTLTLANSEVKTGWMEIIIPAAPLGQPTIEVLLRYQRKVAGNIGGQASIAVTSPAKKLSFPALYLGSTRTGVALTNPNEVPAEVIISLRNQVGRLVYTYTTIIVAKGQSVAFLDEMVPRLENFDGLVEVTSNVGILATALQATGDDQTFNFSTIPVETSP